MKKHRSGSEGSGFSGPTGVLPDNKVVDPIFLAILLEVIVGGGKNERETDVPGMLMRYRRRDCKRC